MEIKVLDGQDLLDIAIQQYGTVEAVFEIAAANGLSITNTPETTATFRIPDAVTNAKVVKYYADNRIVPATGNSIIEGGIGWWAIEYEFTVS
jgi:hypothetical protein